ncbi:MAG TPA: peptide-methionine (R)-S-oxide reductase MsrB [Casimicrobiaceae bacterium]|nr:peptide-methionine (R)-S-oxide reductase MsrB [Casimicrobiaceae bacterium]
MRRRVFLATLPAVAFSLPFAVRSIAAGSKNAAPVAQLQRDWQSLLAPGANVTLALDPIKKSEAEWKQLLDPAQFNVLRQEGTERPFSSPLNDEKRPGVFVCAGCTLPLFTSAMKFDSGTGWPSFFTLIPEHLGTKSDYKIIVERTEYHCVRCGGHQGHVFDDGPPPTGLRYCNNGVALRFIPLRRA